MIQKQQLSLGSHYDLLSNLSWEKRRKKSGVGIKKSLLANLKNCFTRVKLFMLLSCDQLSNKSAIALKTKTKAS